MLPKRFGYYGKAPSSFMSHSSEPSHYTGVGPDNLGQPGCLIFNNRDFSTIVDMIIKPRYNPKRFGKHVNNCFLFREYQSVVATNLLKWELPPTRSRDNSLHERVPPA